MTRIWPHPPRSRAFDSECMGVHVCGVGMCGVGVWRE